MTRNKEEAMALSILILAAGQGTRMRSSLPKVLHTLGGIPLLQHVLNATQALDNSNRVVVVGHGREEIIEALDSNDIRWVTQEQQLGTGHAVLMAMEQVSAIDRVLVLYGDVPLIEANTLETFLREVPEDAIGLITTNLPIPDGFGRIHRDDGGDVVSIVECKDASATQKQIQEVNTGIMLAPAAYLKNCLPKLGKENAQGEYYLTDVISIAVAEGKDIHAFVAEDPIEVSGVNDPYQLSQLERHYQANQAKKLMLQGVKMADPNRFDLRGELSVGQEVFLDVNVVVEGKVKIGARAKIGPNVVLKNATIGDDVEIKANTLIEAATIDAKSVVGPFARIRPETHLMEGAKVGNFVEVKKSTIGKESKVNHLSYIGDTQMGTGVNIGAGTITCNYDGANKHQTIIGDNVFVGSGVELVAPIQVPNGVTIGAGTTMTIKVPENKLVVGRARQKVIENWQRPLKTTQEAKQGVDAECVE